MDELQDQSSKTEALLAQNKSYTATHKALTLQLEIHERTEEMLQERAATFQAKIRKLNEQFKQMAATQKEWEAKAAVHDKRRTSRLSHFPRPLIVAAVVVAAAAFLLNC